MAPPVDPTTAGQQNSVGNSGSERSVRYKRLKTKRENAIKRLKYHADKAKSDIDPSQNALSVRLSYIESAFESLTIIMKEFESLDEFDEDDMKPSTLEMDELYLQVSTNLKQSLKENPDSSYLNASLLQAQPHTQSRFHQNVKLPRISIPTFDGNYQEWIPFYDAFSSLIDSNPDEPDIGKMHHLRSCLSGTAFRLISTLPATETNYKIAWKMLCDRFHNKRALINACLASFINQPQIKSPNAAALRSLIDTSREAMQTMETLGVLVEEWDAIVVYLLQLKLDKDTLKEWELHIGSTVEVPKFSKMIDFLETQWRVYDITNNSAAAANNNAPAKVFAAMKVNRKKDT